MGKYILACLLMMSFTRSYADTQEVNRETIISKSYTCTNGGTLRLLPTRYGNVKKAVFSKAGSLDQIGYVSFWNMTDHYDGSINTFMTFPDRSTGEEPTRGKEYANVNITFDGEGLTMSIIPLRASQGPGFSCKNY